MIPRVHAGRHGRGWRGGVPAGGIGGEVASTSVKSAPQVRIHRAPGRLSTAHLASLALWAALRIGNGELGSSVRCQARKRACRLGDWRLGGRRKRDLDGAAVEIRQAGTDPGVHHRWPRLHMVVSECVRQLVNAQKPPAVGAAIEVAIEDNGTRRDVALAGRPPAVAKSAGHGLHAAKASDGDLAALQDCRRSARCQLQCAHGRERGITRPADRGRHIRIVAGRMWVSSGGRRFLRGPGR